MTESPRTPEVRIVPEPGEQDREAIAQALARVPAPSRGPARRTSWWRKGVRESVSTAPSAPPRPPR